MTNHWVCFVLKYHSVLSRILILSYQIYAKLDFFCVGLPAITVGEFIHTNTVHRLYMVIPSCQSQVAIIFSLNNSFPLIPCRQRNSVKCSYYDNHLNLSVQSKLRDSVRLKSGCIIWNIGCNPGHQLSLYFMLLQIPYWHLLTQNVGWLAYASALYVLALSHVNYIVVCTVKFQ